MLKSQVLKLYIKKVILLFLFSGSDIDCFAGRYIWTDVRSRTIRSSNYDGTERRPMVSGGQHCLLTSSYFLGSFVYFHPCCNPNNFFVVAVRLKNRTRNISFILFNIRTSCFLQQFKGRLLNNKLVTKHFPRK